MTASIRRLRPIYLSLTLILAIIISLIALTQLPQSAVAQDGQALPFAEVTLGQVAGPDGALYNFQGNAGEVVTIEITGIGPFRPALVIQDANHSPLAREDNLAANGTASLSFTIFNAGLYYIQVLGANNTTGQFTLLLNRASTLPLGIALAPDTPLEGSVAPAAPVTYYDFSTIPDRNTRLEVRSLTQGYSPIVTVYLFTGEELVTLDSERLAAALLEFSPTNEVYKLAVQVGNFPDTANYRVSFTYVESTGTTSPEETAEPDTTATLGACLISTQQVNGVNVRNGGSTGHITVGDLEIGETAIATGYNSRNDGWYEVELANGVIGWVASFVVDAVGDCSNLPAKNYPPAPTATPTPTDTPTPTTTVTATASPFVSPTAE